MADHNAECDPVFGDYVALLKPRVMSLVVFTAFVGLMAAPVSFWVILFGRMFETKAVQLFAGCRAIIISNCRLAGAAHHVTHKWQHKHCGNKRPFK